MSSFATSSTVSQADDDVVAFTVERPQPESVPIGARCQDSESVSPPHYQLFQQAVRQLKRLRYVDGISLL